MLGCAEGLDRAKVAATQALSNPLLGTLPTESASGLLVTITGGQDMKLFEVDEIMDIIQSSVSSTANIIFGTCYDQQYQGKINLSIIVSGINTDEIDPPVKTQPPPVRWIRY